MNEMVWNGYEWVPFDVMFKKLTDKLDLLFPVQEPVYPDLLPGPVMEFTDNKQEVLDKLVNEWGLSPWLAENVIETAGGEPEDALVMMMEMDEMLGGELG